MQNGDQAPGLVNWSFFEALDKNFEHFEQSNFLGRHSPPGLLKYFSYS